MFGVDLRVEGILEPSEGLAKTTVSIDLCQDLEHLFVFADAQHHLGLRL